VTSILTSAIEDVVFCAHIGDVGCSMAGSYVMLLAVKEIRKNKNETMAD